MNKQFILGEHSGISELYHRASDLGILLNPTVDGRLLVRFIQPLDNDIDRVLTCMQANCTPLTPYAPDAKRAEAAHKQITDELRRAGHTKLELVVLNLADQLLAGEGSNLMGNEGFAVGQSLYGTRDANRVQAITLVEPAGHALYGARLPIPGKSCSEMYLAAKAKFPDLLKPLATAVAKLE